MTPFADKQMKAVQVNKGISLTLIIQYDESTHINKIYNSDLGGFRSFNSEYYTGLLVKCYQNESSEHLPGLSH